MPRLFLRNPSISSWTKVAFNGHQERHDKTDEELECNEESSRRARDHDGFDQKCHFDESTPTNRNLPCQGGRPLPTTRRYLRINYRNCSRQIRQVISSSFSLLLLYKREDVRRRHQMFLIRNWLPLVRFYLYVHRVLPVSPPFSLPQTSIRFYPPIFSPPISFLFHPFHNQKRNDGNHRSVERFGTIAFSLPSGILPLF